MMEKNDRAMARPGTIESGATEHRRGNAPSWKLALALTIAAVLLNAALQTRQLLEDRLQLKSLSANLDQPASDAAKMREQLNRLASSTAKLAAQGDVPAQAIIDALRKQGIDIHTVK
jgi:hypothetical protein